MDGVDVTGDVVVPAGWLHVGFACTFIRRHISHKFQAFFSFLADTNTFTKVFE